MPSRSDSRAELDDLIARLVDRPGSASVSHADGPSRKGSRPNSVLSASQLSGDNTEAFNSTTRPLSQSIAVQTDVTEHFVASAEPAPAPESKPKPEVVTYSKGVQTDDSKQHQSDLLDSESETGEFEDGTGSSKRLSKRDREHDEEIRRKLRREIEEELQATQQQAVDGLGAQATNLRYPLRTLDEDELKAVTSSEDFLDFVERSAKVIERALDEEYDVLADYELGGGDGDLEEDDEHGRKRKSIKEVCQFWDERWSKKRMISDLSFSPKVGRPYPMKVFYKADLLCSFRNWFWQHTRRIPLLLTNRMA